MSRIQAFSSVSVVDLTDVGVINFYLTSNQPNSVIYDPNTNNGTYSPNWASSRLDITPVISYNGSSLALNATGLVITYQRKEGTGTPTSLTTGEAVVGGVLQVSANKMASVSSGQLTYICNIEYTDPDTGVPITSQASLTYTLVTMASQLKYAGITGENTFLYNTSRNIVGTGVITLTADLTNCSVVQWQYKRSDGTFAAFPTTNNDSISGDTLDVHHDEANIWLNDKIAIIKLVTNDNDVYDITQINKIYDGAAGNSTVAAVLTNENHVLAVKADGTVKSWAGASTEIHIYEGGNDVTSQWTITKADGTGLTGTYNSSTHVYTPSSLTADNSYADFTCTRTGYSNITKRYTITKQYAGADGEDAVIYEVVPDVYSMNLSEAGVFTPTSVTFNAYKKVGETLVKSTYSGRFIISESTDGGETFTAKYTSNSNEATKVYTPSANTVNVIKCVLYAAGGTSQQLDDQSVVITKDGKKGTDGHNGSDGLSMGLGNYSDVIPCNSSGKASAQRDISIPFYAYKGITRVAVTATVGTLPTSGGISVNSNTEGTTSSDGLLVLRVANGATFGSTSAMTGDITITLTAEGKSVDYKYTWTKSKQAANGTNAVLLQLYSEDGGNVEEGKSTIIKAIVHSGTSDVTSSSSFVWKEFKSGEYKTISGQTGSSITITPDMVTDQMWLKCEAKYPTSASTPYSAYYTIDDTTDPISAITRATISEFKNSQGFGAIYTRVYREGVEVDTIKSTTFSSTAPTGASSGDYYYHLDSSKKTCILKKYNGTSWVDATAADGDEYTYSYYRVDNKGDILDTTTPWKTGRCQYIDPSIINGRMQFFCEVSEA